MVAEEKKDNSVEPETKEQKPEQKTGFRSAWMAR